MEQGGQGTGSSNAGGLYKVSASVDLKLAIHNFIDRDLIGLSGLS